MSMVDLAKLQEAPSLGRRIDRRLTSRFPVKQEIRYRMMVSRTVAKSGVGMTLDISSGGILFTTKEELPIGRLVEIAMHWPARLNGTCPLQFVASGRVLRSNGNTAAVRIQRYEFRTRAAKLMTAVSA